MIYDRIIGSREKDSKNLNFKYFQLTKNCLHFFFNCVIILKTQSLCVMHCEICIEI